MTPQMIDRLWQAFLDTLFMVSVSAGIAAALYPQQTVRAESFTDSPFPDGTFDAVVGNVPFANVRLLDPNHNPGRQYSMHNHFILKSLALTRPGGMVAVLTSRFTLDAVDDSARRDMWQMADLVTAVRLPTGAHRHVAGTEAVTDLLVFRVRGHDERKPGPRDEPAWLQTTEVDVARRGVQGDTVELDVNAWFVERPDLVLGAAQVDHGMYHAHDLVVTATAGVDGVGEQLSAVLWTEVDRARAEGLVFTEFDGPRVDADQVVAPVARAGDVSGFDGHISRDEDGTWRQVSGGVREPLAVPRSQERQLRQLLGLRDSTLAVLQAEAASRDDTEQLAGLRSRLDGLYEAYVARFGPINTVKVTQTAQVRASDGQPVVRRTWPAAMKTFTTDPHAPAVMALEDYDEATDTATKMPILSQRVVQVRSAPTSADTPQDAVAIVLDQTGEVRLEDAAALLGVDEPTARDMLGQLVFDDPAEPGRLVPAAEYLSGNVRQALQIARDAAGQDDRFGANVTALEAVMPPERTPAQMTPRLGAVWIPDTDIAAFLSETLHDTSVRVLNTHGSEWEVQGNNRSQAATSTWGTQRMDALSMAQRMMQLQKIVVEDSYEDADGKQRRVINPVESTAAQAKAEQLTEAFTQWLWRDPQRTARLAKDYNRRFNSHVLRSYDQDGQQLSLPGLAAWFDPHPWQRAAVARIRSEPSVGLFHEVGAGKTAEMIMGAAELRRLGMVRKPLVVVPNNMLEQFTRDWMGLYPQAMVLAAGPDEVKPASRERFVAKAATGDWDAIIMTHSAFGRINVSDQVRRQYVEREIDALRASLARAEGDRVFTRAVKRIEAKIIRTQETLKARMEASGKTAGVTFEQMGVDYLVIDELHEFKNLALPSKMQGVTANPGSNKATDLDMKLALLRERAGVRGRVATGATATPIANSIAETYVMEKYLRPDLLTAAGIEDFDSWAATFAKEVTNLEMNPTGGGFRFKTRLGSYQNVPDLLRTFHVFADVKTAEDLPLNVPDLAVRPDGQRAAETVLVEPSEQLLRFVASVMDRARQIEGGAQLVRASGKAEIVPTLSGDGRKAALDMQMVVPEWAHHFGEDLMQELQDASSVTKLDVVADRVHRIWEQTRDRVYPVKAGSQQMHPAPGGLQIVFLDLGTPTGTSWNAYADLRTKLADRGMDPARVAFAHDAKNDQEKERLFARARSGDFDVIIGSTSKMGVGTNMQLRAVALHHVDCPWRPDQVRQREGRILRQGNANPEIQILRYATKKSFDAYMWQTVERKADFINQFMHGTLDADEVEEIKSAESLSYAEMKAGSADNPLLMERTELEADLAKLERLEVAHGRDQSLRQQQVVHQTGRIDTLTTDVIPRLQAAITARVDTSGDRFAMTVGDRSFTDRTAAAAGLRAQVTRTMYRLDPYARPEIPIPDVARLGGHSIDAIARVGRLGAEASVEFTLRVSPERAVTATQSTLSAEGIGLISSLEHRVTNLDRDLDNATTRLTEARKELAEAQSRLGQPFDKADDLARTRHRMDNLMQRLQDAEDSTPETATANTSDSAPDQTPQEQGPAPDQARINAEGMAKVRDIIAGLERGQQHGQNPQPSRPARQDAHRDRRWDMPPPGMGGPGAGMGPGM